MSRTDVLAATLALWDSGEITDTDMAAAFLDAIETPDPAGPEQVATAAVPTWNLRKLTWVRQIIYPLGGLNPIHGEWHLWNGTTDVVGTDHGVRFLPMCNRRASDARPRIQTPSLRVEFAFSPDQREQLCAKCLGLAGERSVIAGGWA